MLLLLKLVRSMIKGITSQAAPWQIALGTLLGVLIGMLPLAPIGLGPSWAGFALIAIALAVNCHLGSVIAFFGVGWGLAKLLALGPAVVVGQQFDGVARWAADTPWAHGMHLSHQGHLGLTLIAVLAAPLLALAMHQLTVRVRARLLAWQEQRRTAARVAKIASTPLLVRFALWFFAL